VSNYYNFSAYANFSALCLANGIFPLFGVEALCLIDDLRTRGVKINDPGNPGKMYLCGKGITRFSPLAADAADLLGTMRQADAMRMESMIKRLNLVFGNCQPLWDGSLKRSAQRVPTSSHGVCGSRGFAEVCR
jgi:hypothetical protein